ncbi:MAG: NAD-dependent epimerase/dehydratase family protein [Pseudomonadales bacterium]
MAIVLVGGTGFIGRHVCEALHLRRVPAVTISYTPHVPFLRRFAPSLRAVEANSPAAERELRNAEVLVYLAHRSRPGSHAGAPHLEVETNVVEAIRFFDDVVSVNSSCRIIYASSGGQIYGRRPEVPIDEASSREPVTPYGLGKLLVEECLAYLSRTSGVPVTVLRMGNPVGKWQLRGTHGFVAAAVRAACTGEPLTIYGRGENKRDYFDADDVAELICDLCGSELQTEGTFNIGSGHGRTENEIIALIQSELTDWLSVSYEVARDFDLAYAVLDVGKAHRELGWKAKTPLAETLRKLKSAMRDPLIAG